VLWSALAGADEQEGREVTIEGGGPTRGRALTKGGGTAEAAPGQGQRANRARDEARSDDETLEGGAG